MPIAAKLGDGVQTLLDECEKYAVDSPFFFPEDMTTDQPERQVMAEIIREKLLWNLANSHKISTYLLILKF